MTNRSTSKQHGLHSMNETRPKSKLRNRRNKAKASARREANPMASLHTRVKGEAPKRKEKTEKVVKKPAAVKKAAAAKKPTAKKVAPKKSPAKKEA